MSAAVRTAARPPAGTAADLATLGVATVYEASGRAGLLAMPLVQLIEGSRAAGPARIAACGQGDNRAVHEVMAHIQPGDVLVLRMPRPERVALFGELLATQARHAGAAAVLVDAGVRDIEELRRLGLPVWTRWVTAAGATKAARGQIDVPVAVGGSIIAPGDFLVLDADGAVAVEADRAPGVVADSRARVAREQGLLAQYNEGTLSYDLYGMRAEDEGGAS